LLGTSTTIDDARRRRATQRFGAHRRKRKSPWKFGATGCACPARVARCCAVRHAGRVSTTLTNSARTQADYVQTSPGVTT
jgi:hypothetical protein